MYYKNSGVKRVVGKAKFKKIDKSLCVLAECWLQTSRGIGIGEIRKLNQENEFAFQV